MKRSLPRWYGVALAPAGAWAVHELRYGLAFGSSASGELAHQGHRLSLRCRSSCWLPALALGAFMLRLARTLDSGAASGRSRLLRLWSRGTQGCSRYSPARSSLEGAFAAGHPEGLAAVIGRADGWRLRLHVAVGGVSRSCFAAPKLRSSRAGARPAVHERSSAPARPSPLATRLRSSRLLAGRPFRLRSPAACSDLTERLSRNRPTRHSRATPFQRSRACSLFAARRDRGRIASGLPAAASAHQGDPNYQSVFRGLELNVPGLSLQVLGYDNQYELINKTGKPVTVLGYQGSLCT